LRNKKKKCDSLGPISSVCSGLISAAQGVLDAVGAALGGALDAVAFLVEQAGDILTKIFQLHEASFDLVVQPNDPGNSCLDLKLKVTVLGENVDETVNVCLDDVQKEIEKLARKFAKSIFAEIDSGKNSIVEEYKKENPGWANSVR